MNPDTWRQIKNVTTNKLIRALEKDGWVQDETRGAVLVYRHPDGRRVTVHYHPSKTYGANLLKALLDDIGWTEDDMRRLKLIR
jgi:predicted RNA binding protein YcfA (HicA-like mRNA interferase family)